MIISIDGNFDSKMGDCEYHCCPSCHPAQVGRETIYGCRHKAWPQNRAGDFVPIVACEGNKKICDMKGNRFISHYRRGLKTQLNNAQKKVLKLNESIKEINDLLE